MTLDEVQIRRHRMLEWYHEKWNGKDWNGLVMKHGTEFKDLFGRKIAPAGSPLSRNLVTVLKQMSGRI